MAATVEESTPPDIATAMVGLGIAKALGDAVAKKNQNGSGRTDYLAQL
jgi:hypothetical protein